MRVLISLTAAFNGKTFVNTEPEGGADGVVDSLRETIQRASTAVQDKGIRLAIPLIRQIFTPTKKLLTSKLCEDVE